MMWGSVSDFFAMGGYALYVWGSFGVTAFLMILEVILVRRKQKQTLLRLSRLSQARAMKVRKNEA